MKELDGYALTMAGLLAVSYVASPFVQQDFDVSDMPVDAPPVASVTLATSGTALDAVRDEIIDVRPFHDAATPTVSKST
jgi:hypothetical protein